MDSNRRSLSEGEGPETSEEVVSTIGFLWAVDRRFASVSPATITYRFPRNLWPCWQDAVGGTSEVDNEVGRVYRVHRPAAA
jgi:hypothetical protein